MGMGHLCALGVWKKTEVLQQYQVLQAIRQQNAKKCASPDSISIGWHNRVGQWMVFMCLVRNCIFFMINSQLDDGVLSQTTTLVKYLPLNPGTCKHTNVFRVIRIENQPEIPSPKITSSHAHQEASTLRHTTEIRFMKLQYTVEDRYQFQGMPENSDNIKLQERSFISSSQDSGNQQHSLRPSRITIPRNKNKKICLFQKTTKAGNSFLKRNTKNIPKNFCKAYCNYMETVDSKGSEEWSLAMRVLRKLERRNKHKYNNILMHKILSNPRICPYFKQFLSTNAADWINVSKINDKQVHLEAIDIYSQLISNLAYAEVDPPPSDQ